MTDRFYEILRYGVTKEGPVPDFPSEEELSELVRVARLQGVSGDLFSALDYMQADGRKRRKGSIAYGKLISLALQVENGNRRNSAVVSKLSDWLLRKHSVRSCVLKGLSAARYYPDPTRRQPGDIDLWIEGSRNHTLGILKTRWGMGKVVYHHCSPQIPAGVDIEAHFRPSWMFNPFTERRLDRWLDTVSERQFSNVDAEKGFAVTTADFDSVYILVHAYRHLFDEGISFKHVLDYYHVLRHLDEGQKAVACGTFKNLRMERFASGMMYVLKKTLCIPDAMMLCPPDREVGERILAEVADADPTAHQREPFWRRLPRRALHRLSLLGLFPQEVLWAPVFKTCQFFWRLFRGYL